MKTCKKSLNFKQIDGYRLHNLIEGVIKSSKGSPTKDYYTDKIIFKLPKVKAEIRTPDNEIIHECYNKHYKSILIIWKPRWLSSLAEAEDEVNIFMSKLNETIFHFQNPPINKTFINWCENYDS